MKFLHRIKKLYKISLNDKDLKEISYINLVFYPLSDETEKEYYYINFLDHEKKQLGFDIIKPNQMLNKIFLLKNNEEINTNLGSMKCLTTKKYYIYD